MAKKATSDLAIKPATKPAVSPAIHVDARIGAGMFFALAGTILAAFGFSTRDNTEMYVKSLGFDANLWWGLLLLAFGIAMLAFGRRGQTRMEKAQLAASAKTESTRQR